MPKYELGKYDFDVMANALAYYDSRPDLSTDERRHVNDLQDRLNNAFTGWLEDDE